MADENTFASEQEKEKGITLRFPKHRPASLARQETKRA